jgi:hypothetical protein
MNYYCCAVLYIGSLIRHIRTISTAHVISSTNDEAASFSTRVSSLHPETIQNISWQWLPEESVSAAALIFCHDYVAVSDELRMLLDCLYRQREDMHLSSLTIISARAGCPVPAFGKYFRLPNHVASRSVGLFMSERIP